MDGRRIAAARNAKGWSQEYLGQQTGETAYSEKMRMGRMETYSTSYVQKAFGGTWGCVIRRPNFIATMTGI